MVPHSVPLVKERVEGTLDTGRQFHAGAYPWQSRLWPEAVSHVLDCQVQQDPNRLSVLKAEWVVCIINAVISLKHMFTLYKALDRVEVTFSFLAWGEGHRPWRESEDVRSWPTFLMTHPESLEQP